MPIVSRHDQLHWPDGACLRRVQLGTEMDGIRIPQRRCEEHHEDPGDLGDALVRAQWCPARRAHDPSKDMQLGTRAEAGAVEDSQPDGHCDPLLHPDQGNGEQRDRRQAELEQIEASDGDEVAEREDPSGHEEEHRRERRLGHVPEQTRCRNQGDHCCRCAKPGCLGSSARRYHGRGSRRAGVHRERAGEAGLRWSPLRPRESRD